LLEAEPWRGILLVNPRLKPNLEKPLARFAAIIENTVDRPQEEYGVPQLMRMLKLSREQTPKIPLEFGGGLCASFDA
jgi:hypothetical protein